MKLKREIHFVINYKMQFQYFYLTGDMKFFNYLPKDTS